MDRRRRARVPRRAEHPDEVGAALGLTAAGILCAFMVGAEGLLPLFIAQARHPTRLLPGLVLVTANMLAMLYVLAQARLTQKLLWITSIPLFLGILVAMPYRSTISPINLWAPGYWALAWVACAVLVLPRRAYLTLSVALPTTIAVLDLAVQHAVGAPITRWTVEPIPGFFTPILLLVWLCDALLQLARHRDTFRQERETAEEQRAAELAATDAQREAARLVHDHLLHALHAVAQTGSGLDFQAAASECGSAFDALTAHHAQRPTLDKVCRLVAEDPALTSANATLTGGSPPLPGAIARAMAAAVHEALNNIVRHANAAHAWVDIDHDGVRWTCTIRDDGVGFDTDRSNGGRMGVRSSIHDRMTSVGGVANIESAPGKGTTVTLQWPGPDISADDETLGNLAAHNATARAAWPSLAFAPVFTAILWPFVHPVWPVLVACAVLVGVGTFHILRLRHHALTPWDSASLLGTSLAVWAVNLWCAPDVVHTVHPLWMAWGCAALAHLVVLQGELRRGLLALVGWGGAMTTLWLVRYDGHVDWANVHLVITVGLCEAIVSLVAFHRGLGITNEAVQQHELARAMRRDANHLGARSQLDQYWSQRVTSEALPLLNLLANHPRAIDEQMRRHANQLEATLRDELLLGPNNNALLTALRCLREAGWKVATSIDADEPDVARAATILANALGAPAVDQQSLTLSSFRGHVVAVALTPSPEQARRWKARFTDVQDDPDFVRISVLPLAKRALVEV